MEHTGVYFCKDKMTICDPEEVKCNRNPETCEHVLKSNLSQVDYENLKNDFTGMMEKVIKDIATDPTITLYAELKTFMQNISTNLECVLLDDISGTIYGFKIFDISRFEIVQPSTSQEPPSLRIYLRDGSSKEIKPRTIDTLSFFIRKVTLGNLDIGKKTKSPEKN